ncbi:hypothetical protein [Fulvivirga lutea]|uniref:Uncharacterized protein n=1 Tax=Fulvivirga lutea TaxID=2810512 RepID=A0A974WKR6_9BACT|nr:hypothetical protein [Fulvivirga lutea]QSE99007.1 hypothetical protein JR347_07950 [Fulvivirga lutea]
MQKLILTTSIMLFAISFDVFGCSCSGNNTIESEIDNSSSVILGRIISEEEITLIDSGNSTLPDSIFVDAFLSSQVIKKFQVELIKAFKGNFDSEIIAIYSGRGGGDCGYHFEIDKTYVIYADDISYFEHDESTMPYPKGKNIAWTNICDRTNFSKQSEIHRIEKYLKTE